MNRYQTVLLKILIF